MFQVAIVGARGYLGRELVRLLLAHPKVDQVLPVSLSGAGGEFGDTVPAFRHMKDLPIRAWEDQSVQAADVYMFATGHGDAARLVPQLGADKTVIDLSRDHRRIALQAQKAVPQLVTAGGTTESVPTTGTTGDAWTYGLADTPFQTQKGATRIANPGCYPTASLLATLPAFTHDLIGKGPIIVDGKSGLSGAGATPRADLHFPEANESVRAYKVLGHDHLYEIQDAFRCHDATATGHARPVRFTPHLVPQNRGLLATVYAPLKDGVTTTDVEEAYRSAYHDATTVRLVDEADTAPVRGTVLADIAFDVDTDAQMLVARGAIDNLVKGGSGQAIHNLNLALGLDPLVALPMLGGGP